MIAVLGSEDEGPKAMLLFMESMFMGLVEGEAEAMCGDDGWTGDLEDSVRSCSGASDS